ncbi:MAG: LD-carboxypeptidase, partial [Anaerolineae bacterium]
MNVLKPNKLQTGDTIGIVAPSLPLFADAKPFYEQAKAVLVELGFNFIEGKTMELTHRWSAGTADQQADDINGMFANPQVKAIIGHTGGFSSMGVVDLLDYELIRNNPKPFIGLSDITVYQWAMFSQTGLVGFHGNDLTFGFGQHYHGESAENKAIFAELYASLLTSTDPLGPIPFSDEWEIWRPGTADGTLIGGNLKRFMLLAGTDYFPPIETFNNSIL